VLEMKKQCERCGGSAREGTNNAWICSFECTFCSACAEGALEDNLPQL